MAAEILQSVCSMLSLKSVYEWTDIGEITGLLRTAGLNDAQIKISLSFLKKYFLEFDEHQAKAKLDQTSYYLFRE